MSDPVLISIIGSITSTAALVITLLINKRTNRIESKQKAMHDDINGRITQLVAAKDEIIGAKDATIAGKQELSEATGKAAGIAEKQVEIDKMNKDLPATGNITLAKEDIVEKTKDAVKEKVEDIKPGDIVGKKKKK